MFKLKNFNSLMDAAGDGIIIGMGGAGGGSNAGDTGSGGDAGDTGGTNETAEQKAAREEAERNANGGDNGGDNGGNTELKEVSTDDKFQLDFLSSKYEDTSLLRTNANGDITNTDGEVLVKKEDLTKGATTSKNEHIEQAKSYISSLDDVIVEDTDGNEITGTIAENGDVVDKDGNVVMAADEFVESIMKDDAYMDYDPDALGIYDAANKITGFDFEDENGEPISFDETPEGVAARDLHIAKSYGTKIAQDQINTFFSQNPDVEDFYYYVKAKGSPEGFGQMTNHEGVTVAEDNEQQHIDLIVEAEMMRGNTKERAMSIANLFKDNDKAYSEAKDALAYMQGAEKKAKEDNKAKTIADRQAKVEEQEKYWGNVQQVLDGGKLKDINIPKNIKVKNANGVISTKTIQDFYNYISKDTGNGLTQEQLDASKDDLETKLMYQYLRFTGHDFDYLVSQRANQQNVRKFKNKYSNNKVRVPKGTVKVNSGSKSDKIVYR